PRARGRHATGAATQIRTSIEATGAVTLAVAGRFTVAAAAEFARALERARTLDQLLFLDLTGVTQIDRPTLRLVNRLQYGFRLISCPAFVERRIDGIDGIDGRVRTRT